MNYNFVYKNIKTGEKKFSMVELHDADLKLVFGIKKTVINAPIRAKKTK